MTANKALTQCSKSAIKPYLNTAYGDSRKSL